MDDMNKQSKRFYEILDVIKELHDKKRHDYGANEDDDGASRQGVM